MSIEREIVYSDHSRGNTGDFPVAVVWKQKPQHESIENLVVDPIFDGSVTRNLYGRIMTLLEATFEGQRLEAVKTVFGKELTTWANDVYTSAREIAEGGDSSLNIYTRPLK